VCQQKWLQMGFEPGISRQHRDMKAFFALANKRAIAKFVVLEQSFESLSEATVL